MKFQMKVIKFLKIYFLQTNRTNNKANYNRLIKKNRFFNKVRLVHLNKRKAF